MTDSENYQRRILIIDDNPAIHDDFRKILGGSQKHTELDSVAADFFGEEEVRQSDRVQFEIDSAFQGDEGLQKIIEADAQDVPFAMAFVDMRMPPGWDGLKTVEEIWKVSPDTQIVVCTAYCDRTWQEFCDRLGTTDRLLILKKPFEGIEVIQLAIAMTEKFRVTKESHLTLADLERRVEERTAELKIAAQRDGLTGIANRTGFNEQLFQSIKASQRLGHAVSVMILDVDYFKSINDTFGHPAGDSVLCAVADRINGCLRDTDLVARLGGDEFAIIQSPIQCHEFASALAGRVSRAINEPLLINGETFNVEVSIGIAVCPADGIESTNLLKNADLALYRAKADGRNCYRFFKPEFDGDLPTRGEETFRLKNAFEANEFELWFQPQFSTISQTVEGFETQLSWNDPERGLVSADAFLRLAEQTGMFMPLGRWLLNEACAAAMEWPEHVRVAVNVTAIQIFQKDICEVFSEALQASGLDPQRLEIEITETVLLRDAKHTMDRIAKLKDLGVRIVIDEFGTGYSSLGYLRRFPFDKIKLDRSFVRDLERSPEAMKVVRTVASMGQCMEMETTADGVESAQQLERVAEAGYTQVQGDLRGKPVVRAKIGPVYFPDKTPMPLALGNVVGDALSNVSGGQESAT